jgi:hypothetical protein
MSARNQVFKIYDLENPSKVVNKLITDKNQENPNAPTVNDTAPIRPIKRPVKDVNNTPKSGNKIINIFN